MEKVIDLDKLRVLIGSSALTLLFMLALVACSFENPQAKNPPCECPTYPECC